MVFTSKTHLTLKYIKMTRTGNDKLHFVSSELNLFQKHVVHKSTPRVYLRTNVQVYNKSVYSSSNE